jgi:hypothetical protein
MTKTLVEQLRTEPDPEWFRALMITAASRIEGLERALRWSLEYIDAIPADTPLPAMPGFDRDYVNGLLARSALSDKG